jgi:hypothetical protein
MFSGALTVLFLGSVLMRLGMNESRQLPVPSDTARYEVAQTSDHPIQVESRGSL